MRTLFVGALAASLAGCSCYVPPPAVDDACIGTGGYACFDRSSVNQTLEPELALLSTSKPTSKVAATTEKPASAQARQRVALVIDTAKSPATTTVAPAAIKTAATKVELAAAKTEPAESKVEPPAFARPAETSDEVIAKATAAIASKLEDPKSAEFGEMKRAMRTNPLGKSVDTICGHVKARKASGEGVEDKPFLYLVKDDEAYVVDGPTSSIGATAYHNICN
jgi:hypothetical protein